MRALYASTEAFRHGTLVQFARTSNEGKVGRFDAGPSTGALTQSRWPQQSSLLRSTSSINRKSVVEGKSVDLGGRRIIKKNRRRAGARAPAAGRTTQTFSTLHGADHAV